MTRYSLSVLCALRQPVLDQPVDKAWTMRTHEENRAGVCCICWQKSCEKMATIVYKLNNIIREYAIVDYDPTSTFFPWGLSSSCLAPLYIISLNENKQHLNGAESFDPGLTASTRCCGPCSCRICSIARVKRPCGMTSRKRKSLRAAARPPAKCAVCPKCVVGKGE